MTYNKIMERLQHDYAITRAKYEVLGVFLFGSQNYNCQTDTSDIDTKVIVIPTLDEMILGQIKINETIPCCDGEITIFDIKHMHDYIKKQNINFLEILFTDYYIINPKYETIWEDMRKHAEKIARLNEFAAVQCINGVFMNKYKKLFHAVPSNAAAIEKYGYDGKALADCVRLYQVVTHYIQKSSYAECLKLDDCIVDYIMTFKTYTQLFTVEKACEFASLLKDKMDYVVTEYNNTHEEVLDYNVLKMIDRITIDCCRAYIKGRIGVEYWPN